VIANIKKVQKACAENRAASLNNDPRLVELVWSFVDGQQWTAIYRGLREYDPKVLKWMLWRALKGPTNPLEETLSSNGARNTAFELLLAGKLQDAGASVKVGERADILFEHAGARLYIECKRPFQESTIAENVSEARDQLRKLLDADTQPGSVGSLVAIDVSKVLNPGSNWFMVDEPHSLEQLTKDVKRLHERHASDYTSVIDIRLGGMLYYLCTPAYVRKSQHPLYAVSHAEFFLWDGFDAVFRSGAIALRQLFKRLESLMSSPIA
jgi:hypothetical protein